MRVVDRDLLHRLERRVVGHFLRELPTGAHVHAATRRDRQSGREDRPAQHVADDVRLRAVREVPQLAREPAHVVARREPVVLLLVDPDDSLRLERRAPGVAARADERVVSLGLRQHQEEFADSAAEAQDVERRELFARDLEPEDAEPSPPQVVRGRRAQRKCRHLPEAQAAVEWRLDELPLADHGLLAVPADGVVGVVGPDPVRVAVLVGAAVAVGDDNVALREARHVWAHGKHLA